MVGASAASAAAHAPGACGGGGGRLFPLLLCASTLAALQFEALRLTPSATAGVSLNSSEPLLQGLSLAGVDVASFSFGESAARILALLPFRRRALEGETPGPTVYRSRFEGPFYRIPSLLWVPSLKPEAPGYLLAFAEKRQNATDYGQITIVLRRSANSGKTWLPEAELFTPAMLGMAGEQLTIGNPTVVYDEQTGKVILLFVINLADDRERDIVHRMSRGSRWVYVSESLDAGVTWLQPREITSAVKKPEWTWYATGPGTAIQMSTLGPFKGRIVVPCDHTEIRGSGNKTTLIFRSHIIYSDDGGANWKLGAIADHDSNECAVAELGDGSLLVNSRDVSGSHHRVLFSSRNGGSSFVPGSSRLCQQLPEPGHPGHKWFGCQASMVSHSPWGQQAGVRWLLFANPESRQRHNLTLKVSFSNGDTWERVRMLHGGPSGYSSLAVLPPPQGHVATPPGEEGGTGDGGLASSQGDAGTRLACLYECGVTKFFERIDFVEFPMADVLEATGPVLLKRPAAANPPAAR